MSDHLSVLILRALAHSMRRLTPVGLACCAVLAGCQPAAAGVDAGAGGVDASARDASVAADDAFASDAAVDASGGAPEDGSVGGDAAAADASAEDASAEVSVDYCPATPTFMAFNASEGFRRYDTGGYDNRPDIGIFGRPESLHAGETFVVRMDVAATDSTVGRLPAALGYGDIGASRAGKLVSVSRSRCDFTSTAMLVSGDRPMNSGSAEFSLNEPARAATFPLTTGTWYINVQIPLDQCPAGTACDVVVDWANH